MAQTTHNTTLILGQEFVPIAKAEIEFHVCGNCGVTFGASRAFLLARRKDGKTFYCPNGHNWSWTPGESEEQKLRRQLEAERDRRASLIAQRDQLEASLRAQKGATTRARNEKARIIARVANGVCPCCGRTFAQLARHMAAKHPEFIDETTVHEDTVA